MFLGNLCVISAMLWTNDMQCYAMICLLHHSIIYSFVWEKCTQSFRPCFGVNYYDFFNYFTHFQLFLSFPIITTNYYQLFPIVSQSLHHHYTIITPLLHHYYIIITQLLHHYYKIWFALLQCRKEVLRQHSAGSLLQHSHLVSWPLWTSVISTDVE